MTGKNIFAIAALTLGACSHVSSAEAEPPLFILDNDHTHIVWQVDRFGFTNTVGTFADVTGTLKLDPDEPEASEVTASISVDSLRSDLELREEIVRSEHWLKALDYPEITFSSTSVSLAEGGDCAGMCANVTGDVTLLGVTRPLKLFVQLNKAGTDPVTGQAAMGFTATGTLSRSEFGLNIAYGVIGDEVSFQIEALALLKG